MRKEHERNKYYFLPPERNELHPTFQVDGLRFTCAQYDKRRLNMIRARQIDSRSEDK